MSDAASELGKLRAELAALRSELARSNAVVSASEALIEGLKIAMLKRDKYGRSAEHTARLIDQLEELETAAAEEKATKVRSFERRKPVKKPFPEHLPRERVVVDAPTACACCGSDRIVKMGEDITDTLERGATAVEGDPDRPREVHMSRLREDQPAARPVPPDPARLGWSQPIRDDRVRAVRPAPAAEPLGRPLCPRRRGSEPVHARRPSGGSDRVSDAAACADRGACDGRRAIARR